MSPHEIEDALKNITLLVDTREQLTDRLKYRLESSGLPYERRKLDFGDYSAVCGNLDLSKSVVIERKMNLDELALCLTSQRARFEREFIRARDASAKIYLLIENASWDVLYSEESYKMRCHSKFSNKAMIASLAAWVARYNIYLVFCNECNTGRLIREILFREVKERIVNYEI